MISGSQQFESVILSIKTGPIPFPKNDSHHMTMPTMNPLLPFSRDGVRKYTEPGSLSLSTASGAVHAGDRSKSSMGSEWPTRPMQCIVTAHSRSRNEEPNLQRWIGKGVQSRNPAVVRCESSSNRPTSTGTRDGERSVYPAGRSTSRRRPIGQGSRGPGKGTSKEFRGVGWWTAA